MERQLILNRMGTTMDEHSETVDWYGEETATFGDRLAAAREAARLSQKELAQRVGIKTSTLRNWEEDLSEPRANRLSILSGILGVSLRWLLTAEGEGLLAPEDDAPVTSDVGEILSEVRAVRAQLTASNDRLAKLEKRLRRMDQA
ncbi:MAG: helix-turn-helix domain-containing protein [Octadecabacter sp.]|nr:helix-turn-helix domain-containing protein [Octadecabacter sp.]